MIPSHSHRSHLQDIEGKCSLFWGSTSDGSLAFSDDDQVLKNGCGTSFAPFPAGNFSFISLSMLLISSDLLISAFC